MGMMMLLSMTITFDTGSANTKGITLTPTHLSPKPLSSKLEARAP